MVQSRIAAHRPATFSWWKRDRKKESELGQQQPRPGWQANPAPHPRIRDRPQVADQLEIGCGRRAFKREMEAIPPTSLDAEPSGQQNGDGLGISPGIGRDAEPQPSPGPHGAGGARGEDRDEAAGPCRLAPPPFRPPGPFPCGWLGGPAVS